MLRGAHTLLPCGECSFYREFRITRKHLLLSRSVLHYVLVRGSIQDDLIGNLGLTRQEARLIWPWTPRLKWFNNDEASPNWPVIWRDAVDEVFFCLLGVLKFVIYTTRQKEFCGDEKITSQLILFVKHQLKVKIRTERWPIAPSEFGKKWKSLARLCRVGGADLMPVRLKDFVLSVLNISNPTGNQITFGFFLHLVSSLNLIK